MLNKQKGNMYPWVTHTWNVIKGKCPHDCSYCYMKVYPQKGVRFAEGELKTNLGHHNTIFVGSSCDMWAGDIPDEWIAKTLKHCRDNDAYNIFLFQTKNPQRFYDWFSFLPDASMLGCTIESNRYSNFSKAPPPLLRQQAMKDIPFRKMVSIEPIMDFDLEDMVRWIREIKPKLVSIGADSKGHNLPEPPPDKIRHLIRALKGITQVKVKDNLDRLLEGVK